MDNPLDRLRQGLARLGCAEVPVEPLWAYAEALLKWNQKVSLTAITQPLEVVEKHLLDSLTALPEVGEAKRLLDLGAGAGLPGIPLAVASPALRCTLVDAVAKKVSFIKVGAVAAGVAQRVKALHLRAAGRPEEEGVSAADVVIARALMDVASFLPFAMPYLAPGGRVVAMLGRAPPRDELERHGQTAGLDLVSLRSFELPFSRAPRAIAVYRPAESTG